MCALNRKVHWLLKTTVNGYKTISENARDYLLNEGWLLFEHGYDQGAAVREILHGFWL